MYFSITKYTFGWRQLMDCFWIRSSSMAITVKVECLLVWS